MTSLPSSVQVISHPIINHALSTLRLSSTSARDFRACIAQISTVLAIHASSDLDTIRVEGQGPLSKFEGDQIKVRESLAGPVILSYLLVRSRGP